MWKPTSVHSPARGRYSGHPGNAGLGRAPISAGEQVTQAPTSLPARPGPGRPPGTSVRPALPPALRPGLPVPPPPGSRHLPAPGPRGAPAADPERRGKAQGRAPALSQGSRGRRGATSRAAATRRLPRRARRNRAPRGSARAQCSRPGCAQASALGPAHAPALARLPLAPRCPSTGGRSAEAAPAVPKLTVSDGLSRSLCCSVHKWGSVQRSTTRL